MGDGIEGETEDPKLLLLALTQQASDFAPISVMDAPPELVTQFLPVELKQDPSPKGQELCGKMGDGGGLKAAYRGG